MTFKKWFGVSSILSTVTDIFTFAYIYLLKRVAVGPQAETWGKRFLEHQSEWQPPRDRVLVTKSGGFESVSQLNMSGWLTFPCSVYVQHGNKDIVQKCWSVGQGWWSMDNVVDPTHLVAVLSQLHNLVVVAKFTSVSTGLAITPTSGTGAMTARPCTPKEGNEREDDSRHWSSGYMLVRNRGQNVLPGWKHSLWYHGMAVGKR